MRSLSTPPSRLLWSQERRQGTFGEVYQGRAWCYGSSGTVESRATLLTQSARVRNAVGLRFTRRNEATYQEGVRLVVLARGRCTARAARMASTCFAGLCSRCAGQSASPCSHTRPRDCPRAEVKCRHTPLKTSSRGTPLVNRLHSVLPRDNRVVHTECH